ncbi:calcitonin gene-related peptide type 1 receptor-like [Octopus vulgaris]|nr:calcitonin gene-related peptide type 1 receptor-like [Octopus vulgaris]
MNTTTNAANRSLLKQHYSGNLSNFSGINSLPDQCNSTALSTDHLTGGNFCESTFDGYLCWNPTKAGERVSQPCPLNHAGLAFKDCLPNATWFRHPVTNLPWTDFTSCFINHTKSRSTELRDGFLSRKTKINQSLRSTLKLTPTTQKSNIIQNSEEKLD